MDKLKNADLKRRDSLVERLNESFAALEDEHRVMSQAIETFNASLDQHNEIINEAAGWRDDLVAEIDEFIAGRSDKWNEGDKGRAVAEWKSALENLDLEPAEALEIPDLPDLLHADTLEKMPTEADE